MNKLKAGTLFHDRFSIIEELGAGGMGVVYHSRQLDADRHVALKVLILERIAQDGEQERFLREFQILSRLSHPNIMSFYLLGLTAEGIPYAACEYIEGESLQKLLSRENKLPWRRAVHIGIQIVDALQFAHSQEIIHRDLKPANVMIMQKPEPDFVKLIDFGLARIVEGSSLQKLTFTGQLLGSVHYMSPEQCQGGEVDARGDIYALACLLFEAISGERLFEAENPVAVIHQQVYAPVQPRLQISQNQAPAALISLLERMLAKNAEERPASMDAVKTVLQTLLISPTATASGASWVSGSAGTRKATISKLSVAVSVLLVLAISSGLLIYFKSRSKESVSIELGAKKERGLQSTPHNIETLFTLANELHQAGKNKQELQLLLNWWQRFRGRRESDLDSCRVLLRLAELEQTLGNPKDSDKCIIDALILIRQNKESPERVRVVKAMILLGRGGILLQRSEYEQAKEPLRTACNLFMSSELQPVDIAQTCNCVGQLARTGEYQLACRLQQNVLDADMICRIGDLQLCMGENQKALTYYLQSGNLLKEYFQSDNFPDTNDQTTRIAMPGNYTLGKGAAIFASRTVSGYYLAQIAERIGYFDRGKARDLIESSVAASQKEFAYGMKVNWNCWADLNRIALDLGLPEQVQLTAKNTILDATNRNSSICKSPIDIFNVQCRRWRNLAYFGGARSFLAEFQSASKQDLHYGVWGDLNVSIHKQELARTCFVAGDRDSAIVLANDSAKMIEVIHKTFGSSISSSLAMQAVLSRNDASGASEKYLSRAMKFLEKPERVNADSFLSIQRSLLELKKLALVEKLLGMKDKTNPDETAKVQAQVLIDFAKYRLVWGQPLEAKRLLLRAVDSAAVS